MGKISTNSWLKRSTFYRVVAGGGLVTPSLFFWIIDVFLFAMKWEGCIVGIIRLHIITNGLFFTVWI